MIISAATGRTPNREEDPWISNNPDPGFSYEIILIRSQIISSCGVARRDGNAAALAGWFRSKARRLEFGPGPGTPRVGTPRLCRYGRRAGGPRIFRNRFKGRRKDCLHDADTTVYSMRSNVVSLHGTRCFRCWTSPPGPSLELRVYCIIDPVTFLQSPIPGMF